ncbi:4-(cytidine 5'-diphospho)-2-C-methyl-D-erythritol kinase [Helicobacter labacensis]|uniref:4-(cytidine 5'-diphospho)-2-C-methyl-D-erythritol kinase n=1 Tax=Helicobacter labacensis TaxID=2316079 RepID=UPI000EAF4B20|nr:4-(cytidine 5'-diphospho)-2-C-methyl-D-erythritol kinase [Helicobacter labacensis]
MNPFGFAVCPKVNIFLKISGCEQGYHLLDSRLVLVANSFKDYIQVKRASKFSLKGAFDCPLEQNTIFKAWQALKAYWQDKKQGDLALEGLQIEVEKHIPSQAGFGGGSADAGGFLNAINTHLNLGLGLEELYQIGARVGSDVNFFISGFKSAHVSHFGEVVQGFEEPLLDLELYAPKIACSTKAIYRAFERSTPLDIPTLKRTPSLALLQTHPRDALNDLLAPALQITPELRELEARLGPQWFFSGSGSGFFAPKGGI